MALFTNDYMDGIHPEVLRNLLESSKQQQPGYGEDGCCQRAADLIREACGAEDAQVHFLSGGTQVNMVLISAVLRPHQAVVSAECGHIYCSEASAIEATGHRVRTLPSPDYKIEASALEALLESHSPLNPNEHNAEPGLVYITQPSEYGALYSRAELEEISRICHAHEVPLYLDGARMASAITTPDTDCTLQDIARLCDAFYIGGTKCGALMGEALVITSPALVRSFRNHMKMRGALLAKSWTMGAQFEALFSNGLYQRIGQHQNRLAKLLRDACPRAEWLCGDLTNVQYLVLPKTAFAPLEEFGIYPWGMPTDERPDMRLGRACISWATREEDVLRLAGTINAILDSLESGN